MERYANGDDAAFAEVYDAIAPRLFGFLLKARRDRVATEDLMQQTFLQMHRARGSFISGAPVMPWALAIARRLLIDSARRWRVERAHATERLRIPIRQICRLYEINRSDVEYLIPVDDAQFTPPEAKELMSHDVDFEKDNS